MSRMESGVSITAIGFCAAIGFSVAGVAIAPVPVVSVVSMVSFRVCFLRFRLRGSQPVERIDVAPARKTLSVSVWC